MSTQPTRPGSEETVLALDNIPLDLPIAGVGSRALAAFLDYLIVGVLTALWIAAVVIVPSRLGMRGGWVIALFIFGLFLLDYGYFAGVEVWTGGRSFGKWALGVKVVTRHGGRPGTSHLLLRNAVRSVDLLVGVWLMLLDPLGRRLGDRLGGTLVVHVPAAAEELLLHRIPAGWGAREVAVLESFLRRAAELEPERSQRLARDLLYCIEHDDPALLAGVARGPDPLDDLRRAVQAGNA